MTAFKILTVFLAATLLAFTTQAGEQRYPDIRTVQSRTLCLDYFGVKGYYAGFSVKNTRNGFCPQAGVAFGLEINDANTNYQFWTNGRNNVLTAARITNAQNKNSDEIFTNSIKAVEKNGLIRIKYDSFNKSIVDVEFEGIN